MLGGFYIIYFLFSLLNLFYIQDKEIVEFVQEVGWIFIILGEEFIKESGVFCLDKLEDIFQRIMIGYGYLEYFIKFMIDEEIQDILDKEWVSILIFINIFILFYCIFQLGFVVFYFFVLLVNLFLGY